MTLSSRRVVTRFAPSPTGFLHIGGARTALFNWLFARHHAGTALLRIEDTDQKRSTPEAVDAIINGLAWLGLDHDGPVVFQSTRSERHREVALKLLEHGHAYRCYATPEELAEMREQQRAARQPIRYDGRWRDADSAHVAPDTPFTVRIRMPRSGCTTIADAVQGEVTVANSELDDFVLLRADGTATYMLAVVVDDHDMGVTHVIRGDDHLNNAFRQLPLFRAMDAVEGGWPDPVFAHIPLIHGSDGAKLSKRHGALSVEAYRDEFGILPEALFNYLLRLGWGHGDTEEISREDAIRLFDLSGVGRSPSRFDLRKLEHLNGHYLREADDARLAALVAERLELPVARDLLVQAMPFIKVRARNLNELAEGARFLAAGEPRDLTDKAEALLSGDGRRHLGIAAEALASTHWDGASLEAALVAAAAGAGLKLGQLAQPLRAALTGTTSSPGIFDVLVLLGREESMRRIRAHLAPGAPQNHLATDGGDARV
ncbi:glutamate--tRNA ligase [Qipengyuania thermophila]|uniref:glutamate--tRNA ligase n=1 Tax=Qipengyuania thermophila TaxID=2509361 RepID=UPI0026C22322